MHDLVLALVSVSYSNFAAIPPCRPAITGREQGAGPNLASAPRAGARNPEGTE